MLPKPKKRPVSPYFSSGPCKKRPGWTLAGLERAWLGRSHRSPGGRKRLLEVIHRSARLLHLPEDWRLGIVPGSDTGAMELALWSLLGARGVDVLAWESFGKGWLADIVEQLRLEDVRCITADYGKLPDLAQVDGRRDTVLTWNGTTSGVRVPDGNWIDPHRGGLVIADATSAVFAMELPYDRLDVVTWSWQKVLGGEAAHGMLALSPRAVERLESFAPERPMPKLFRLTRNGRLNEAIFTGLTINTPSMLAVEDALDALHWAESIGGLEALMERTRNNFAAVENWVKRTSWVAFLATDPATRSPTSICLKITDPWFTAQSEPEQRKCIQTLATLLAEEGVAHDIGSYRDAPPGLRLWGGATVETADLSALGPWLDWAYASIREQPAEP